jgi:lipopolysaccharide/colanic/teichoic acid biosynthesis glycosyltransferase
LNIRVDNKLLKNCSFFVKRRTITQTKRTNLKKERNNNLPYKYYKPLIDRIFAVFFLVVLSPLFAVITVMIKLDSRGKVIFSRDQVGEHGRIFKMYKFRTMQSNNDDSEYKSYIAKYINEGTPYTVDENGQAVYKVVNDPRVTRFGAMLRKSNLDELPQFFNILKGDMSLVGPRPDIPFAVQMYQDWHHQRLQIKPGLMGLWQVQGRKNLSFEDMVRMDIEYIEKQSLILDTKIILKTIWIILRGDGS